jgi:hypothetical protein
MTNRINSEKFLADVEAELIGDSEIDYGVVLKDVLCNPNTQESEFRFSSPRNPTRISVNGIMYFQEAPDNYDNYPGMFFAIAIALSKNISEANRLHFSGMCFSEAEKLCPGLVYEEHKEIMLKYENGLKR